MSDLKEKLTILLVEDDEGHARLIEKNLRRADVHNPILPFDTGQKVIDFLFDNDNKPRKAQYLILLDLNLPELDGYEVLKRIKSDPVMHAIPVIILTTTDNPSEVAKCYELGCNIYVTKPVDYESFSEAITKLGLILSIIQLPDAK